MNLLQLARPNGWSRKSVRSLVLLLLTLTAISLPTGAFAAEGDNVVLNFSNDDNRLLWVAFAIGVIAFAWGFYLRTTILKNDVGGPKMQEVGKAIQDGALAYLKQQITTMVWFVLVLAVALIGLFWDSGLQNAVGVGVCFVFGVLGSYLSGYTGMLMAVASNMRVANAALSSPRKALEIAFRSGGVAGLITIGVALMGATLILIFGGSHATTLLVGFGFGGSLAALFMRVGGGIFTKAADVGADLVGKVEAGIPEDDPRNPAVIADNVGDNVGDCAGMVADVFESYEVTLVAAIVLGAASSAILDQATWSRLIVFALVAAALGLSASLVGILSVKGSDDADSDPLKPITGGFWLTAGLSTVLIGIAAFILMGGVSNRIQTTQLVSSRAAVVEEVRQIQDIQAHLAIESHKEAKQISSADVLKTPEAKKLGLDEASADLINQALTADLGTFQSDSAPTGYEKVTNPEDKRVSAISVAVQPDPSNPSAGNDPFRSLGAEYIANPNDPYVVRRYSIKGDIPSRPSGNNRPPIPGQHIDTVQWVGPERRSKLDAAVQQAMDRNRTSGSNTSFTLLQEVPASVYVKSDGKVAIVVDSMIDNPFAFSQRFQQSGERFAYYAGDAGKLNASVKSQNAAPGSIPPRQTIELLFAKHAAVPWWSFFLPIFFGIVMALGLEKITDYYVSTHRKPTQEVAGVSSAGPAPMIIQGFAYACESSVFMTLAIVLALIFPLFIFSPDRFGSYILSFYGIALVGLGMLTTTGFVLAMDTFGPISDNAQGVYEMSGEAADNELGAKTLQRLDAAGNTTKALTKGFAIATAVIASAALFHSYVDSAHLDKIGLRLDVPEIFLGLLIGGAAPFLFAAFTINAVGRASFELIDEVRRQFRDDSGIMAGTSKPDYARCVAIVTAAAQKELLAPGILAIALPVAVAFGFSIGKTPTLISGHYYNLTGAQALGGFLAGAILSGQLLAVLLANAGGMWDNAKKLIEDGLYGGKGSEAHKASVVCDTVGDPFKDTAGPAMNPLIKVMNLVGLLLAGVVVRPFGDLTLTIITAIAVALLAISISISKNGSMSSELAKAASAAHQADDQALLESASSTETTAPDGELTKKRKTIKVEED